MTPEYQIALETMLKATKEYNKARFAYHASQMSDDEFLKARAIYKKAEIDFDIAFSKEEGTETRRKVFPNIA
jgi:hypothetical protein